MSAVLNLIDLPSFPCTMAKTLKSQGGLEIFKTDAEVGDSAELLIRLKSFSKSVDQYPDKMKSFVVEYSSKEVTDLSFSQFEKEFWSLLGSLRNRELNLGDYDSDVSERPMDPDFGFSIDGRSYFLIMLHPDSPRLSRRAEAPAIVFNLRSQFQDLREKGIFERIKRVVRRRDKKLQGFINPMMSDHGDAPEWMQYSGREMKPESKCPFAKLWNKIKD